MRRSRNKYGNIPITIDGIKFQSTKEGYRYSELKLMQKGGAISELQMQVPFELQPAYYDNEGRKIQSIRYFADFVYIDNSTGEKVIEDVKSPATRKNDTYRMKKKMMGYRGWFIKEI